MDPNEIITLVFPNYTKDIGVPVIQKWRASTLCMIPHFERMLNPEHDMTWKETESREITMEEDPEVFANMISLLKAQKMEKAKSPSADALAVMADYYGVTLPELSEEPKAVSNVKEVVCEIMEVLLLPQEYKTTITLPPHEKFVSFMMHNCYNDYRARNVQCATIKIYNSDLRFGSKPTTDNSNMICNAINTCKNEKKTVAIRIPKGKRNISRSECYYIHVSYVPL